MEDRDYLRLFFRVDLSENLYETHPEDFFDFLGDMGGIQAFLMTICSFFVSSIVSTMFKSSLMKDSYQVQKYTKDMSEYYVSKHGSNKCVLTDSEEDRVEQRKLQSKQQTQ